MNTDAQIDGWTHTVGTAQYTNAQTGLYLIQYNAQLATVDPGTNSTLRATLNLAAIPGSQANVTVPAANQSFQVSRSFIASINASDVLTIQFTGNGTGVRLSGSPGISMTIVRIQ